MPVAAAFVGGMFSFGAGTAFAAGGAAFGGWVAGAAFSGTIIGGLAVKLMTTVALSALGSALSPDPAQGGGLTIQSTVQGEHQPETITLGRYATGGQAICPPYSHGRSNRYLTHVIELCSAPGAQLSRLMLGDEWVDLVASDVPGEQVVASGAYSGLVWLRYHDGRQTEADPWLVEKHGSHPDRPWTADMVGHGLCYAVLIFGFDDEKLTQVPRYRFELSGIPVYDLRKDSSVGGAGPQRLNDPATWTASENPIVQAWNVMHGIVLPGGEIYGGGIVDLRKLPRPVWTLAMNRCDVSVARPGGGTEPAFRAGLEIALDQPPAAALEELFKAASATVADLGYGWGVVAGAPALPVYSFTDDDVIVSRSQELDPFPGLQQTYNAVSAKFPDPEHFWETKEAPQRTNAGWETSDAFGRRMADLSLPAAPYSGQVQRLMRAWIEDERRFRRHVISLPPDAAHVELIDTLDWSSLRNGYEGKDFSVHEILEDPRIGIRQMSIRERNPLDYSWQPGFELPSAPGPAVPAPVIPEQVSGYAASAVILTDQGGVARRVGIRQVWDSDILARGIRWQIRLAATSEVILEDSTQNIAAGGITVVEGILHATSYEIRARLIKARQTNWTSWRPVNTPDVGLNWADWDAQLREEIQADLERANQAGDDAREALDLANAIRGDLGAAQAGLTQRADEIEAQALTNLNIARGYTDTSFEAADFARLAGDQALAAQIQTLTAVLNSENYLENPRFTDGLAGWSFTSGATTVVDQDDASADPVIADAPTQRFARTVGSASGVRDVRQDFAVTWEPNEVFQWRAYAAAYEARTAQVVVVFYDAGGVQLGSSVSTTLNLVANQWRVFSGQHTPPAGTESVRLIMRVPVTSVTTAVGFADASFTKVDQSLIARITDLEVVVVNNEEAFTLHRNQANSRLGANEAAIASESATRTTQFGSISSQLTTVSAQATRSRTFRQASAPADPQLGDTWYDTSRDSRPFRWSGIGGGAFDWLPVDDTRVGPLVASVTTQATAIADLQDGASAGYLINVQAGDAVSLIDMIAADGSGRKPVSIIKMQADDILLDGTVSIDKLVVTNLSNLVFNDWTGGDFRGWATSYSVYEVENRQDAPFQSVKGYLASYTGGDNWVRSRPFTARVDEDYLVEIHVLRSGATPPDGSTLVQMRWETDAGPVYTSVGSVGSGGLQKVSGIVKAPANTVTGSLWVRPNVGGTSGLVYLARPIIRRAADSVMIADGAVIAQHVNSDTVRALNGRFSSLAAANVTIGNGELGTLKLGGKTVTVPATQTLSAQIDGNGGWRNASSITFTLPFAGEASIDWYGSQSYAVRQSQAVGIRLRINGVSLWERVTGDPPGDAGIEIDWLSMGWSCDLNAGAHLIQVDWWGGNSNLRLFTRTLKVQGSMR